MRGPNPWLKTDVENTVIKARFFATASPHCARMLNEPGFRS